MARYEIRYTQRHANGAVSENAVEHEGPQGLGAAVAKKFTDVEEGIVTTSVIVVLVEDAAPQPAAAIANG